MPSFNLFLCQVSIYLYAKFQSIYMPNFNLFICQVSIYLYAKFQVDRKKAIQNALAVLNFNVTITAVSMATVMYTKIIKL